ncbi:hypothetical protein CEV33_1773 [Brucella grignonensis]|uniref:Uncharacterized protein n=1 Tax=Brucella grignonensis TaxID=94627 RepID=A0A256F6A0_9HYPH|nr:hypothetical protein CEV33_1773 [Brucella grignonensis]
MHWCGQSFITVSDVVSEGGKVALYGFPVGVRDQGAGSRV